MHHKVTGPTRALTALADPETDDLVAFLASLASGPVSLDRNHTVTITAANAYGSRVDGACVST